MSPTRAPSRDLTIATDAGLLSAARPWALLEIHGEVSGFLVSGPVIVHDVDCSGARTTLRLEHVGLAGWVFCTAWAPGRRVTRTLGCV